MQYRGGCARRRCALSDPGACGAGADRNWSTRWRSSPSALPRPARRSRSPASACSSPGAAAWTKAGHAGCSSSTASNLSASTPRISVRRSATRSTWSSWPMTRTPPLEGRADAVKAADAEQARLRQGGCASGRQRPAGGRRAEPPGLSVRNMPTRSRRTTWPASRSSFAAAAHSSVSTVPVALPMQQFKLPVKNAVEGLRPEEFFLRGSIVEVTNGSDSPGDGRHAGKGGRLRRRQPGLRDS